MNRGRNYKMKVQIMRKNWNYEVKCQDYGMKGQNDEIGQNYRLRD